MLTCSGPTPPPCGRQPWPRGRGRPPRRGGQLIASETVGVNVTGVPVDQAVHFRNGNVVFAYLGQLLLLGMSVRKNSGRSYPRRPASPGATRPSAGATQGTNPAGGFTSCNQGPAAGV